MILHVERNPKGRLGTHHRVFLRSKGTRGNTRRDVAIPTFTTAQWGSFYRIMRTKHGRRILEEMARRGMELERKRLQRDIGAVL